MRMIRNVVVDGRRTSMRLEPEIWAVLEDAAAIEGLAIGQICSLVKQRRNSNLSSAVRVFALLYRTYHQLAPALEQLGPAREPMAPLVPSALTKVEPVETRHIGCGSNCVEGLSYALEALPALPVPVLREALGCWHTLRPDQEPGVPAHDTMLHHLERLGATRIPSDPADQSLTVTVIDVTADDPHRFTFGEAHEINCLFAGRDISHRPVADHPFQLHAREMLQDYGLVKTERAPMFHVLRHTFGGKRRHYARLTVPLSSGGRAVDTVMSIAVRLSPPTLPELASATTA